MMSPERAYYSALFRRDFDEAQRLYRELVCTDAWTADRVVREAHKCGIYDAADRDEDEGAVSTVSVAVITNLRPRDTRIAA
jgi:hypothetical protein